jgi:hypothetical protein
VRDLPATIANINEPMPSLTADQTTVQANAGDRITIGKQTWSHQDARTLLSACVPTPFSR